MQGPGFIQIALFYIFHYNKETSDTDSLLDKYLI